MSRPVFANRAWLTPFPTDEGEIEVWLDPGEGRAEYIRRDPAVLAALPEVQALIAAAEARALDSVTTLHTVIADIRAATVGDKPMLSELAQALVAWRDEAVKAEREACANVADDLAKEADEQADTFPRGTEIYCAFKHIAECLGRVAAAIRKRGEG